MTRLLPTGARINGIAAVAGSFLGLMLGGVLAPIEWRLVFLVSVPFGLFGTVWAYLMLRDNGVRIAASTRWASSTAILAPSFCVEGAP